MKTGRILLFFVFITTQVIYGQSLNVKSVQVFGDYSFPLTKKTDVKITNSKGPGAGFSVDMSLYDNLIFSLTAGYNELKIEQDSRAMFGEWNWKSWKRYYGDVTDSNFKNATQWVQAILKDTNYRATFPENQNLDYFPVTLTFGYLIKPFRSLELRPFIGGGIIFYIRRLFIDENWEKNLLKKDNSGTSPKDYVYTVYSYSYRNMAEPITGNIFTLSGGMDAAYSLSNLISIRAGFNYNWPVKQNNSSSEFFPAKDVFSVRIGFSFNY